MLLKRLFVVLLSLLMVGESLAAQVIPKQVTNLTVNGYPSFPDPTPDPDPQPGVRQFPMRWGMVIGGSPRNYCTDAAIAWLRTFDGLWTNYWDGIGSQCQGGGRTTSSALALVKSSSPLQSVGVTPAIYNYMELWFTPTANPNGVDSEMWARTDASNNWARLQYPNGAKVPAFFDAGKSLINLYPGGGTTNGETNESWMANWFGCYSIAASSYCNGGNGATPIDGAGYDDYLWKPCTDGSQNCGNGFPVDWDRNGVTDQPTNQAFWPGMQQGQKNYYDAFKTRYPGMKVALNCSQLAHFYAAGTAAPMMFNYADVCIDEALTGLSNSVEVYGGFGLAQTVIGYSKKYVKDGGYAAFVANGLSSTGTDQYNSTTWQAQKFVFAWSQVMDMAFAPAFNSSEAYDINVRYWFDYWAVDRATRQAQPAPTDLAHGPSGAQLKWLGPALGDFTTTVNGILVRQFQYGFCAVNPSGNGTKPLNPSDVGGAGLFARVFGLQDTGIDNGATFNSAVNMANRSGLCMPRL